MSNSQIVLKDALTSSSQNSTPISTPEVQVFSGEFKDDLLGVRFDPDLESTSLHEQLVHDQFQRELTNFQEDYLADFDGTLAFLRRMLPRFVKQHAGESSFKLGLFLSTMDVPHFWVDTLKATINNAQKFGDGAPPRFPDYAIKETKPYVPRFKEHTFRSNNLKGITNTSKKLGERTSTQFRLNVRPGRRTNKPSVQTFSKRSFHAWLSSEVSRLTPFLKRKTQFISANLSAQALMRVNTFPGNRATLRSMLESAYVYIDEYTRDTEVSERRFNLFPGTLNIAGKVVTSLIELASVSYLFKKHKPIFKSLCRMYEDGDFSQAERLQSEIDKKVVPQLVAARRKLEEATAVVPKLETVRGLVTRQGNAPSKTEVPYVIIDILRMHLWRYLPYKNYSMFPSAALDYPLSTANGLTLISEANLPIVCLLVSRLRQIPRLYRPMIPIVPRHLLVSNLRRTCQQCRIMQDSNLGLDRCYFHSMQLSVHKGAVLKADPGYERVFQHVEYQGQVFSLRHTMDLGETSKATKTVVGKVAADLYHEYEQPLAQFMSFIGSLYCASSWGAVVAAVAQYASGNNVIWNMMKDQIRKLQTIVFQQATGSFMFSTFSEAIGSAAMSLWEAITSLGLYSLFSTVLSDISSYLFGPLADLVKQIRFEMLKQTGKTIAESILEAIKEGINRIKLCWETKSFAPLWGVRWDPTTWVKQSETIRIYQGILTSTGRTAIGADLKLRKLREAGFLPMWWTDPVPLAEYVKNSESMLEQGYNLISYFGKNLALRDFISSEMKLLRAVIEEARPRAQGVSLRMEPFSVVFYGESSVGKTNLINLLQLAVQHHFAFDSRATYDLDLTQNFQSGLKFDTWLVRMDDVDQSTAPQQAGVRNHIEWFMKLVNNNPLPIEESESFVKGSTFAAPALIVAATNFPDMRVSEFSLFPTAYWRRVGLYLEPHVKAEYATPNGQIDPERVRDSETYDMWDIDVYQYDTNAKPTKVRGAFPMKLVGRMSFPDTVALIIERMQAKRNREIQRLGRMMDTGGNSRCPKCYLPTDVKCGHEPDQLNYDELETEQGVHDVLVPMCGVAGLFAAKAAFNTLPPWIRWGMYTVASVRAGRHICDVIVDEWYGKDFFTKTMHVVGVCGALAFLVNGAFQQGRSANAVAGFNPFNWFRAEQTHKPGIPQPHFQATWTEEELVKLVLDSYIKVSGPYFKDMDALMVNHNTFLVPTHISSLARDSGHTKCMLTITARGETHTLQLTEFNTVVIPTCPELMLVKDGRSFGAPGLIKHFWQVVDEQVVQFDSVRILSPTLDVNVDTNQMKLRHGYKVLETAYPSKEGDCGAVYIGRMGTSARIVAMHFAGNQTLSFPAIITQSSLGACVTGLEIERVLTTQLTTVRQGIATSLLMLSRTPEQLNLQKYPMLSEVHTARSHHGAKFYPFGTLDPPLIGATMKTKIQQSLFAEDFRDLEESWCGERGYWRLPDFRGRMVDEKWKSPYTDAFITANWTQLDEPYMWLALADYISGITSLDCTGFRSLSQHEALVGVPGSVIHGINLSTSTGPPYSVKKSSHYYKSLDESLISPQMMRVRTDILRLFPESIVAAVALCSLKDETLKPGKIPRIFSVLSSEFNTFIKEEMAVVSAFMRANVDFFECCVGINMTGPDASRLVNSLKVVDPSLTRIMAGDAKRLDKSYSGDLHEFVCYVFYAVTKAIGLNPMEAYLKALGIKYTRYIIKNDVFLSFWLPSGFIDTVEWNSFTLSLGDRFVYYKNKYPQLTPQQHSALLKYAQSFFDDPFAELPIQLDFRTYIVLRTYGDDNIKAYSPLVDPPGNYEELWLTGIGIEMTDASKEGRIKLVPLSQADFLKRTFVFDEESGMWMARLSKKTLARMLVFKKDSTLSIRDHAALALTEVLLEAFLHGREFFEMLRARFVNVSLKYSLGGSFLKLPTYDACRDNFSRGTFRTWVERSVPELQELQSYEVQYHGYTMSTPQIVKPGIDPAGNDEVTTTQTNVQHDTGQIVSDSSMIANKLDVAPKFFQTMPTNELGDFMTRATEIATWALASTDTPMNVQVTIDPWQRFLANTRIADKVASYTYIRGTIQLTFVTAVPGNCYGSYVISALPQGGANPDGFQQIAPSLYPHNCMQVDHFSRLDCANSENMVLQLPFLWQYDYADLTLGGPQTSWLVCLTCLSPLQTAIAGGVASGQIQVYANLLDDYQLSVPHFQGHHRSGALRHTPSMATMAPHLAASLPKPEGQVSKVADKVAGVASKLEGVPIIGEYAHAATKAAHAVSKVASWFGFTREDDEKEPIPVTMRSVTNVAHVDGVDVSDKASLTIGNTISIDPTLMGVSNQADCLSTADLFNRWTAIEQISWSPTAAAGSTLGTVYVSPSYCNGGNASTYAAMNMTTSGYFGLPFQYWRGDMEYLIVAPVSKLHRGTLQIYWVPFGSTPSSTVTNTTLNLIYDVSAGGEKQFTIGYARDLPFLKNWIIPTVTAIVPVGTTNGQFVLRVVNPLQSQNSTASVTITVFARAKANMEFAVPRTVINVTTTGGQQLVPLNDSIQYQGASGDEDAHEAQVQALVADSADYPADEILFGEKIESVRPLLQKFSKIYSAIPTANNLKIAIFGENRYSFDLALYPWTFAMHYRNLYQGLAASERYKFITGGDMWIGGQSYGGELNINTQYVNDVSPMTFCGQNRGAEIVIPYYSPAKFYWAAVYPHGNTSQYKTNILWMFGVDGKVPTVPVTIYHAFGSDIRVTCFRQVPQVNLSYNTLGTTFPTWFGHVNPS